MEGAEAMSDTPETDALISVGLENADRECVPAEFTRKLERERDEARERCTKLQDIAERAVNLGLGSHSFSLSETSERIADTLKRWRSTQPCKK